MVGFCITAKNMVTSSFLSLKIWLPPFLSLQKYGYLPFLSLKIWLPPIFYHLKMWLPPLFITKMWLSPLFITKLWLSPILLLKIWLSPLFITKNVVTSPLYHCKWLPFVNQFKLHWPTLFVWCICIYIQIDCIKRSIFFIRHISCY
jgi:hypothetical protein